LRKLSCKTMGVTIQTISSKERELQIYFYLPLTGTKGNQDWPKSKRGLGVSGSMGDWQIGKRSPTGERGRGERPEDRLSKGKKDYRSASSDLNNI